MVEDVVDMPSVDRHISCSIRLILQCFFVTLLHTFVKLQVYRLKTLNWEFLLIITQYPNVCFFMIVNVSITCKSSIRIVLHFKSHCSDCQEF